MRIKPAGPRILTLDIETAPLESYHWGLWDQQIGLEMVKEDWSILSFSAKWLDEPEVIYFDTGGRGKKKVRDDSQLLKRLWKLLDEADIVVAQNGRKFDLKKINARLIQSGFPPYSPIKVIDTMLVAKKHFSFTSNKLAFLSSKLTQTKKLTHKRFPGFELWSECLKDNAAAWAEMKLYNATDVLSTEELYLKLRPWIDGHPDVSVYGDPGRELKCPKCGSGSMRSRGWTRTGTGSYVKYRCQKCGGYARARKSSKRGSGLVN